MFWFKRQSLPGLTGGRPASAPLQRVEPLFELWCAFCGVLIFAAYMLMVKGVWQALFNADPTYLTALIVVLFLGATVWTGFRAMELTRQYQHFEHLQHLLRTNTEQARAWLATERHCWAQHFFAGLAQRGDGWRDSGQALNLLAERAASPHEMPWWLNGVLLKLGLLGKVIGFSILALQLGAMDTFDAGQTATVLKTLTGGLGIALLTTMTGLVANMLLGLQLMRLDRFADALTAKALDIAEFDFHRVMGH